MTDHQDGDRDHGARDGGSHGDGVVDAAVSLVHDLRSRASDLRTWGRRLVDELGEFPDTLRQIREGAANFELVGRRLEAASSSLEEITALYQSTIATTTRRSADVATALQSQLEALAGAGSPERISSTLDDMQRTFESLADLNPFWPRKPKRPTSEQP